MTPGQVRLDRRRPFRLNLRIVQLTHVKTDTLNGKISPLPSYLLLHTEHVDYAPIRTQTILEVSERRLSERSGGPLGRNATGTLRLQHRACHHIRVMGRS